MLVAVVAPVFTRKRLRQVSGGATKTAVGSTTLHNDQDSPAGMSRNFLRVIATWRTKYPMAMLALLTMDETYPTRTKIWEKVPQPVLSEVHVYSVKYHSCPSGFWKRTAFAVRMLPAKYYASSVASRMHHMAFDLLASILGLIWRLLSASSIGSLLTPMRFPCSCRPSSATNIRIAARLLIFSLFTVTLLDSDLLSVCKNVTKEKEVWKVNCCYTKNYIKPNR